MPSSTGYTYRLEDNYYQLAQPVVEDALVKANEGILLVVDSAANSGIYVGFDSDYTVLVDSGIYLEPGANVTLKFRNPQEVYVTCAIDDTTDVRVLII